jgi:restriction endonuclease Mrr
LKREQADREMARQIAEAERKRQEEQRRRWEEARKREYEEQRRQEFARQSTISNIKNLDPLELEQFTAELFMKMGYSVSLTSQTGDHGIDIYLISPDNQKEVVQCKQWKSKKVSERDMREFYGAVMGEDATKGYFVAPWGFSQTAKRWANGKNLILADAAWLYNKATQVLRTTHH